MKLQNHFFYLSHKKCSLSKQKKNPVSRQAWLKKLARHTTYRLAKHIVFFTIISKATFYTLVEPGIDCKGARIRYGLGLEFVADFEMKWICVLGFGVSFSNPSQLFIVRSMARILPTGLIPKTTQNFKPLRVPNPKIPIEFRDKPNPYPWIFSGNTLGYPWVPILNFYPWVPWLLGVAI